MSSPLVEAHHQPSGECVFCIEELTEDNFVEYQTSPGLSWLPALYCQSCIEHHFIAKQWDTYLENIAKADCAAALKRVLTTRPPINVKDAGLPCGEGHPTGEVHSFYFHSDKAVHSAKLKGSLEGEERERFYQEKLEFLTATEIEEEKAKGDKAGTNKSKAAAQAEDAIR